MFPISRLQLTRWLCGAVGLVLAACQAAPTAAPAATAVIAATAIVPATSTSVPSTATPLPTDTAARASSPTAVLAATPSSTATEPAASPTVAPSDTSTATARPTRLPTRPPLTITPLGPPATNSIYSTTGGPAGYSSTIRCQRAGADCAPVMPPGDISFRLTLAGDAAAPWTHFVNYGLSVEKDGANVAGLFMFVDAGWLQPGAVVGFGASRSFSQPGAYVIRSSGCLTTDVKSNACIWATIAGDVVTFTIQ
jgi:hypothetical protein